MQEWELFPPLPKRTPRALLSSSACGFCLLNSFLLSLQEQALLVARTLAISSNLSALPKGPQMFP